MKFAVCAASLLLASCNGGLVGMTAVSGMPAMQNRAGSASAGQFTGNDIPPRYQWNNNFGYCGETSFISAGLYFGQYASQYDVRNVASEGIAQYKSSSQLLIGVNDLRAAQTMHLNAVEWKTATETSTDAFLLWVKHNVVKGHSVIIGVYTNEYRFYHNTKPTAGDPQYDHIVPVIGVGSTNSIDDPSYDPDDSLTFSDNGLWGTVSNPPYMFTYGFGAFQKTRRQANATNGSVYALASGGKNFGVAITGITDPAHETLPVRLSTNVNYERPEIGKHSTVRPAPMPLVLTITVRHLQPGVTYRLYRYYSFASVPNGHFNAKASQARQSWTFQILHGTTYTLTQQIMSDQIAVYRAVPLSGP